MPEYQYIKPWTLPANYVGAHWNDYYSAGVGQSRDSDALERSNFRCMLRELGGESETVIVVRESHLAVGWVEWIAIHKSDTKALETADTIKGEMADYLIIDEDDFTREEEEEAADVWCQCYRPAERVAYIRDHRSQFEFCDFADMLGCVRGHYFAGHASELLA